MEAPSKRYPNTKLAYVLVNWQRRKKGLTGLSGQDMEKAAAKLIRYRQSHVNFLRAGNIPAIKRLASLVKSKKGPRVEAATRRKGRDFGGATPAQGNLANWDVFTLIWNSATGIKQIPKTLQYIQEGYQAGIDIETQHMVDHIRDRFVKIWGG